jgi:hypothetical protein
LSDAFEAGTGVFTSRTAAPDSLKPTRLLEDIREERLPVVPVPSGREMNRRKLVAGGSVGLRNRTANGGGAEAEVVLPEAADR